MAIEYQESFTELIGNVDYVVLNNQSDYGLKCIAENIERYPNCAALYYAQGLLLEKIGKSNDAKISYEKALEINPDYLLGIEAYDKAVAMCNSVNDTASKESETTVETVLKQLKIAIDYLEKAHKNVPEDGFAKEAMMNSYIEVINLYIANNQFNPALEYLAIAVEHQPSNESLLFTQGYSFDKIGKPEEAKVSYEKVIEINPNHFDAWLNLGIQIYNKAIEMGKIANEIPTNKPKEYDVAIVAALEQMNKSVPYFERAYEINPEDSYVMNALMESYTKLRRTHPEYNEKYNEIKAKLDSTTQQGNKDSTTIITRFQSWLSGVFGFKRTDI